MMNITCIDFCGNGRAKIDTQTPTISTTRQNAFLIFMSNAPALILKFIHVQFSQVLLEGCLKFRNLFLSLHHTTQPLSTSVKIA